MENTLQRAATFRANFKRAYSIQNIRSLKVQVQTLVSATGENMWPWAAITLPSALCSRNNPLGLTEKSLPSGIPSSPSAAALLIRFIHSPSIFWDFSVTCNRKVNLSFCTYLTVFKCHSGNIKCYWDAEMKDNSSINDSSVSLSANV